MLRYSMLRYFFTESHYVFYLLDNFSLHSYSCSLCLTVLIIWHHAWDRKKLFNKKGRRCTQVDDIKYDTDLRYSSYYSFSYFFNSDLSALPKMSTLIKYEDQACGWDFG